MSIYKPSNCSPELEEIDLAQINTFELQNNTSGENAKAYKLTILSEKGDKTIYEGEATNLIKEVRNKGTLSIPGITNQVSPFKDIGLDNGNNYQWGARVYNAEVGSSEMPNTLICEGYLVGSTKYVIWSRIPKDDKSLDQIKYDRYIEFTNIEPSQMVLGAKDSKDLELPTSAYTERQKIDWVTKELGNDEDIIKIETEDNFKYNYLDGVSYNIYQCSDEHTVNSAFADPDSNINVSDWIIIYNNAADALAAFNAGEDPGSTTESTYVKFPARKIVGYSSDTGEIRVNDAFSEAPINGQSYRIFEQDVSTKAYTELFSSNITYSVESGKDYYYTIIQASSDNTVPYYSDTACTTQVGALSANTSCIFVNSTYSTVKVNSVTYYIQSSKAGTTSASYGVSGVTQNYGYITINQTTYYVAHADISNSSESTNVYEYQVIGGRPISNDYYKVLSQKWGDSESDKRMFIQPNINIKTDESNPNEIVMDNTENGEKIRIDIIKQTKKNSSTGELVDITFNKLDDTQWMLEGNSLKLSGYPITITDQATIGNRTTHIFNNDTCNISLLSKTVYTGSGSGFTAISPYRIVRSLKPTSDADAVDCVIHVDKIISTASIDADENMVSYIDGLLGSSTRTIDWLIRQDKADKNRKCIYKITPYYNTEREELYDTEITKYLTSYYSYTLTPSSPTPLVEDGYPNIPSIIPQTDYKVYSDFMDCMPYNVFYARKVPTIKVYYCNSGEKSEEYSALTDEAKLNCRDITFKTNLTDNQQSVKYIYYELYYCGANNWNELSYITASDDIYTIDGEWTYRGFMTKTDGMKYAIIVHVVDEYNKVFEKQINFSIEYTIDSSVETPINVTLDCNDKSFQVEMKSPISAISNDYTAKNGTTYKTVTTSDLSQGYLTIPDGYILNYNSTAEGDELDFTNDFTFLTRFKITGDFLKSIYGNAESEIFNITYRKGSESYTPGSFSLKLHSGIKFYYDETQRKIVGDENIFTLALYDENGNQVTGCFDGKDRYDLSSNISGLYVPEKIKYTLNSSANNYKMIEELTKEPITQDVFYILNNTTSGGSIGWDGVFHKNGIYKYTSEGAIEPDTTYEYIIITNISQVEGIKYTYEIEDRYIDKDGTWDLNPEHRQGELKILEPEEGETIEDYWVASSSLVDTNASLFDSHWIVFYLVRTDTSVNCSIEIQSES